MTAALYRTALSRRPRLGPLCQVCEPVRQAKGYAKTTARRRPRLARGRTDTGAAAGRRPPLGRNGSPAFSPQPSHPTALMASACGNAGRGRPGAVGRKIHEKTSRKVVGGGGVRSSYIRRTRKRQGVGLTTEGRRGNARAGTSRGVGRTPGLGQEGAPARARPAGREAGGRRGAGMLPGGQRTGARQVKRNPGGFLADAVGDGSQGPAGKRTGPSRAPARAFTMSGPTGALQGRRGAGAGPGGTGGKRRVGGRSGQ